MPPLQARLVAVGHTIVSSSLAYLLPSWSKSKQWESVRVRVGRTLDQFWM